MRPIRHGSLFSGIGAAEIAAEMLGWENVFHCEINPFGRKVLEYWFPNSDSYEDITKTDFSSYRGKIDILTGGFPCQPFSYAGKRGGQSDDRYLWHEMLRVIEEVRPTWVIGENVNGITTMVESYSVTEVGSESTLFGEGNGFHRYRSEQSFTIERICRDLESKGYSVQPMLIPACSVGAPHRRDRIFIVAYNVADSDCGDDLRESGKYEGEGKEKRLSKWNEVRKFGESGDVRSESEREFICDGWRKFVSDTGCEGLERENEAGSEKGREWMHIRRNIAGCYRKTALKPKERWATFPSVSPVYRRNDGIPFPLDNLTIPFGKWKTESMKAYGNAIVPQVMYQIFKCIDKISNNL